MFGLLQHRHGRGFTLVELLLIVAATSIVCAAGASAYRTYAVRAAIAASVDLAAPAKARIAAAFKRTGTPPADAHAAGLEPLPDVELANLVDTLEVVDGRIDILFSAAADTAIAGRTLSLTPFETADQNVVWMCGNRLPGVGLEPLGFLSGSRQTVQVMTTIEARYLPTTCR